MAARRPAPSPPRSPGRHHRHPAAPCDLPAGSATRRMPSTKPLPSVFSPISRPSRTHHAVDGPHQRCRLAQPVEMLDDGDLVRDGAVEAAKAHRPRTRPPRPRGRSGTTSMVRYRQSRPWWRKAASTMACVGFSDTGWPKQPTSSCSKFKVLVTRPPPARLSPTGPPHGPPWRRPASAGNSGREVNAIDAVALDDRAGIDERYPGGSGHMRVGGRKTLGTLFGALEQLARRLDRLGERWRAQQQNGWRRVGVPKRPVQIAQLLDRVDEHAGTERNPKGAAPNCGLKSFEPRRQDDQIEGQVCHQGRGQNTRCRSARHPAPAAPAGPPRRSYARSARR